MREVYYSSPFVPREWISAHGLLPHRWRPSGGSVATREGICPVVGGLTEEAARRSDSAAWVLTTTCDPMRRAADALRESSEVPVFLLGVPATWQSSASSTFYREELERLGRWLVEQGGESPSPAELAEHLLHEEGAREKAESLPAPVLLADAIPLALLGGPLTHGDRSLISMIEREGGRIVLDGTEEGERVRRAPLDPRRRREDPLGALAAAYFGAIPDAFRRPDDPLHEWVVRRVAASGARGVVLLRYLWCDLWHAEAPRFRGELEVPLLELDLTGEVVRGRHEMRIQAFLEGLRR